VELALSALGQKHTFAPQNVMSAFTPESGHGDFQKLSRFNRGIALPCKDIVHTFRDVGYVISHFTKFEWRLNITIAMIATAPAFCDVQF
jgi:hypothetical protein